MEKLSLLFLTIFLFSCSSANKLSTEEKKAQIYFSQGTQDLVEKNYTSALKNLLEANKLNPKDSKIMTNLAMAYYFKEQKQTAKGYLEKSLEIDGTNSDAKLNLGSIYYEEKNYPKAKEIYLDVSKDLVYSGNYRTLYNLGLISLLENKQDEAISYFNKSLEINANYCPSHFEKGKISLNNGKLQEAEENFHNASIGACFNNPIPLYEKALVQKQQGKLKEAMDSFKMIQDHFPNSALFSKSTAEINSILEKLENTDDPHKITSENLNVEIDNQETDSL